MEEQASEAEGGSRLLDALFEGAPTGLAILGSDLRFVRVNPALAEIARRPTAMLAGRAAWDMAPGLEDPIREAVERVHRDGAAASVQVRVQVEGSERAWRITLLPLARPSGGGPAGPPGPLGMTVRDETDAIASAAALTSAAAEAMETSQTLGALIDASPIPIVVYDLEGQVTLWSRAAERTFGWPATDVLGGPPPTVIPERAPEYLEQLRRTADGHGLERFETVRTTRDGHLLDVLISTAPLRDASGVVHGTLALMEDDTERRRADRRSRQLAALATALSGTLEPADVGRATVEIGLPAFRAGHGIVAMIDGGTLRFIAATGEEPGTLPEGATLPLDAERYVAWVATTGMAVVGARDELAPLHPELMQHVDPRYAAIAVIPLRVVHGLIGVLGIGFTEPTEFSPADRQFLDTVASTCAQALDRARLYVAERQAHTAADREATIATALTSVAGALSAAVSPEDVARVVAERAPSVVGAAVAALRLLDKAGGSLVSPEGSPAGVVAEPSPLDADRPVAESIRLGRAVAARDAAERDARYPGMGAWLAERGIEAFVAVPLVAGDRPIGGLALGFDGPHTCDEVELRAIGTLADACALALERARLYEAAQAAERTLAEVVRQMPVGVVVADAPSARLLFRNAEAQRIWRGAAPGDGSGDLAAWHGFHDRGDPYERGEWPLVRAIDEGATVESEEIEIERADGSRTIVSMSAAPVRDEDGRVRGGVATFSDIAARKEAEAIRDTFVGVIGHELRTPITAIYAGSRLLLRRERRQDEASRRAVLEDIAAEAERLNRLVENTLVLARAERGVPAGGRDPLLLQHLLARIVAAERAARPELHIELAIAPRLPTVVGDEGYVEQVVRNLVSNAAKYGAAGTAVRLEAVSAGDEVLVRVLDQGPGIGEPDPQRLFTLFYRSPAAIGVAPGAGIGLFVVWHLVHAMGGRVWAQNRPEGGAEFGFALRVLAEEGQATD